MTTPTCSLTRLSRIFVPQFPKLTCVTSPVVVWVCTTENLVEKSLFAPDKQYDLRVLTTLAGRWKLPRSLLGQGVIAQYAKRIHFLWVFFLSSHVLLLEFLNELIGIEMQSSFLITFYRSDCSVINWKAREMWWIVQLKILHTFWPRAVGKKVVWSRPKAVFWSDTNYSFSVSPCKSIRS